jgi:hypothetical protein
MQFLADNRRLVVGGYDLKIKIWDTQGGAELGATSLANPLDEIAAAANFRLRAVLI